MELRRYHQKTKIIFLLDLLREHTDEAHSLTTPEIQSYLEAEGLHCDRKTLYSDIQCLTDLGFDILQEPTRNGGGWKLCSREFELAELKLLVDAVQSSRFTTPAKSRALIAKLESLTSKYEAKRLSREVYVANRVKSANENIFYSIDNIHRAIQDDRKIVFSYLEWNLGRKLVVRGEPVRTVSPWALIWQDENYYLLAYDEKDAKFKHFRVDKMKEVAVAEEKRTGQKEYARIDLASYVGETFSMHGGYRETVAMDFPDRLVGVCIDRFGPNVSMRKMEEGRFRIRTEVLVSGQFFGWIAGLGAEAEIVAPGKVREEYAAWIRGILERHTEPGEAEE